MSREFVPPTECPVCGETVPRGARACPGCGADERVGWDEEAARYDGLDLPDAAFDDEQARAPVRRSANGQLWLVVSILVLLAVITVFILR
jgi:hypothetical protein